MMRLGLKKSRTNSSFSTRNTVSSIRLIAQALTVNSSLAFGLTVGITRNTPAQMCLTSPLTLKAAQMYLLKAKLSSLMPLSTPPLTQVAKSRLLVVWRQLVTLKTIRSSTGRELVTSIVLLLMVLLLMNKIFLNRLMMKTQTTSESPTANGTTSHSLGLMKTISLKLGVLAKLAWTFQRSAEMMLCSLNTPWKLVRESTILFTRRTMRFCPKQPSPTLSNSQTISSAMHLSLMKAHLTKLFSLRPTSSLFLTIFPMPMNLLLVSRSLKACSRSCLTSRLPSGSSSSPLRWKRSTSTKRTISSSGPLTKTLPKKWTQLPSLVVLWSTTICLLISSSTITPLTHLHRLICQLGRLTMQQCLKRWTTNAPGTKLRTTLLSKDSTVIPISRAASLRLKSLLRKPQIFSIENTPSLLVAVCMIAETQLVPMVSKSSQK